jgi:nitroreductase
MSTDSPWHIDEAAYPADDSWEARSAFLLRYAVLAPSSHNTQPWRFRLHDDAVDIFADETRWLRSADADRRELYISVGCALENLLIAGEHFGLEAEIAWFPTPGDPWWVARLNWRHAPANSFWRAPEWFAAITARHTNRQDFAIQPLPEALKQALDESLADPNVRLTLLEDAEVRDAVEALIVEADARLFADPDWRKELGYWLSKGVFGTGWLMSRVASLAVTYLDMGKGVARHDADRFEHAAVIGCLQLQEVSPLRQVQAGQSFERLFLAATHHGIQLQPMNQILQLPALRDRLARLLDAEPASTQLMFRLGRADDEGHSPRRPLGDVLFDA